MLHALDIDKEEEYSPDALEREHLPSEVPVSSKDGDKERRFALPTEEEEALSTDALLKRPVKVEPSESG